MIAPGAPLIVLSPHFDDATFSCGALIHRHTREGGSATVVTVFGGAPTSVLDAGSPLARELHARWFPALSSDTERDELELAREGVSRRRAEDAKATEILGAGVVVLAFADCIYRRLPSGRWRCESEPDLFAGTTIEEPELLAALVSAFITLPTAEPSTPGGSKPTIISPLGMGNHVDHRLVRIAAEQAFGHHLRAPANPLMYYEDVPYALGPDSGRNEAVSGLGRSAQSVAEQDLDAKVAAAACYASQIGTFWANEQAMALALREFAVEQGAPRGLAEPVWVGRLPT